MAENRADKPWRILVVDDEQSIHNFYKEVLCADRMDLSVLALVDDSTPPPVIKSPYRIDHAYSGVEGVEAVAAAVEVGDPYVIILLDIRMPPGFDGIIAAQKIRELDKLVKIILISAYADYTLSDIREQIGVNFDFLSKPTRREELLQLTSLQARQWEMAKELEESTQSLIHTNQKLESIISSIPDGLLILDSDGSIEQSNRAAEKMTGYSAEELKGMSVDRLLSQKDSDLQQEVMDEHLKHRDGSTIPIRLMSGSITSPVSGEEEMHGNVLILHDVSLMLRAESARRANKAKDEFLASMSHELRTPLTTIIGNSEMLADSTLDADQQTMVQSVETSGRGLLSLINDILDISKIEAGKIELDEVEFPLNTLMQEVEQIFSVQMQDKGIAFQIENGVDGQYLMGDNRRIAQILINLVGNAMKFTEEGAVSLKVLVEESREQIHFQVQDSGIGMNRDVLDRLFQPFEQADHSISRRFGGTGLGLHISWSLAELMGGDINVESEEGAGSLFTLTLPYHPVDDVKEEHPQQGAVQEPQSFSGEILLAEDTPELRMLISRILQTMGEIEVTAVENGQIAVELAQTRHFDLVLMDMQMPVMDGIEATKRLRAEGYQLPIVALTANVMIKHREQFAAAGCNGFLGKPIDRKELIRVLQQYLSRK